MAACGGGKKNEPVALDQDEKELLELIGEDIHVVTDDDYARTVSELAYHTGEYSGEVYQLEGIYGVENGASSVSRTLVDGENKTVCGLPLRYVQKEIDAGSWVKVTGVVNTDEESGTEQNVLEVVAIESLPEGGQTELPWESGGAHQH